MRVFNTFLLSFVAFILAFDSASADLVFIDFNDGSHNQDVGGFYSSLGVTFQNAKFIDNDVTLDGGSPPIAIIGTQGLYPFEDRIIALFDDPLSNLSIVALGLGANGIQIDAYDSIIGGNLIDTDQAFGSGFGRGNFEEISVNGPGIRRVEIYQPQIILNDAVALDNLTFETSVPEPTSLAIWSLLALGVLGAGLNKVPRKRRDQEAADYPQED